MRIPRGRALCLFAALLLQGCADGPRATNALAEYLAPTVTIDADDPAVVARASALTSGLRTDPERVDAIVRFVREPARREPCAAKIASRLLDCGRPGDTEQVVLLAALARAAGIPARLVVEQVTTAAPSGARFRIRRARGARAQSVADGPDCPQAAKDRRVLSRTGPRE